MGAVHETSYFCHAVGLVILVQEKLLRHFDPDVAAKRAQVSIRIVQEHACQGTGRNADGASKHVEVEGIRIVRTEEGEDLRAAAAECKGPDGRRIVFTRLR